MAASSAMIFADDLLRNAPWRFVSADGGAGTVAKLENSGRKVISTLPKGYVSFANAKNLPIVPGKTYTVTAQVTAEKLTRGTHMLISVGKRTPWHAVKITEAGTPQTLTWEFTAKEGETGMRVHFIVAGENSVDVTKVELNELKAAAEQPAVKAALKPAFDIMRATPYRIINADGGKGRFKKFADGKYQVFTNSAKGYAAFANTGDLKISPDTNYRLTAVVERSAESVKCNMLVSVAKRRPWAAVPAEGVAREDDLLTYDFTTKADEKSMRPHFIVSGKGSLTVKSVKLQEYSDEDFRALKENAKVSAVNFTGTALKKTWKPFNMLNRLPGAAVSFRSNPFGGVECADLDWDAEKIKSLDVRMCSSEPGYIRVEFSNSAGQKSYVSKSAYPGSVLRDYTFNLAANPAWRGKITHIRIIWGAYERTSHVQIARISANSKANIIPFADEKKMVTEFPIIDFLPRAEYKLTFNGNNPGTTVKFFDRHGRLLDSSTLPAGKNEGVFAAPEMTVRSVLTIAEAGKGTPCIEMLNWSKPDKKVYDWRGKWIWSNTEFGPNNEYVWFKREIDIPDDAEEAELIFTADDSFVAYINGKEVYSGSSWRIPVRKTDAAEFFKSGRNVVEIRAYNEAANGGMIGDIYIKSGGKAYFFSTDKQWQYKVGGKDAPAKYTASSLELGAPPTSPWGDLVYLYVGEKGEVSVLESGSCSAKIKVDKSIPVDTDKVTFKLNFPDGSSRLVTGGVTPSTGKWSAGKTVAVKVDLPQIAQKGVTAELASDFIRSTGTFCNVPPTAEQSKELAAARIEGTGSRAHFVINGEKYPPIYYDGYGKVANTWMLEKAGKGNCKIVRINVGMHNIWKAEDKFDFSIIDRFMDAFAVNYPEAKVILKVQVTMPDWWLAKYPDDVTAYHDGRPYSKAHDRHALASARWRKDGAYAMRELMKYLKKTPGTERIFAIGLSEGWNSEWFWSTLGGATSGYSKSDYDTFRSYLKETYGTDAALAKAWNMPGLTFDTIKMPMPADIDKQSIGELLDPKKDGRTIDYFRFRNRALADAIETFAKVVKEESGNRYLVGIYYGYFVMFSHVNRKLQTVGHMEIERLARSPYVDIFWAPSIYHWRQIGMPDGIMQAAETLSTHGKLVVVEQDMRTFSEPAHMQVGNGRSDNPQQSIDDMHRAFGMLLARGVGTHWYDMHEIWFREKVLLEAMKDINDTYMSLSPVKNTTPVEMCLVSDQESAFYTRHNFNRNPNKGSVYEFLRTLNYAGIPFRHVFVNDLLDSKKVPAHKLYILTSVIKLEPEKYAALMQRFAAEKATVIHLYATGVTRKDKTPSVENMGELLGMKFQMDMNYSSPVCIPAPGSGIKGYGSTISSNPWFYPVSGFDKILGVSADKRPVLVKKVTNGVTVYFSTLTAPGLETLRKIAKDAGVHVYSTDIRHALHIGNDTLTIVPNADGEAVINLPAGKKLHGFIGEYKGKVFASGDKIPVRAGVCALFIVR